MPAISRFPVAPYLFACVLAVIALCVFWYGLGKPVILPDAATPTHKLQCASYTPFDKDQSPFDQPFTPRPERMDADLALLAKDFQCVRTYSMTGLEDIPALARKHGLKLMIGAWVNANPVDTAKEINALIASANANPDVVTSVIVGNEVLLRKEVTGAQLVKLILEVKSKIKQPVTYADVWALWLQYPEVAPVVDFVTIHLLPYWDDNPSGIDDALKNVAQIRETFAKHYAPKDIMIGETGWPSEGRQREAAVPSRVNEARFIRGFVAMAEQMGWHYNLIEAFDQPWKRASEGAVGGYWGLFDADRQEKGVLDGPVSNLAYWPFWLSVSGLLFVLTLALAGRVSTTRSALVLPLLAALGACSIGTWGELARVTSRFTGEWVWAAALVGLNLVVLAHAALALSAKDGWRARAFMWFQTRAGWWVAATGFVAAVTMLGLVFDARYRSFPTPALLLPAMFYLFRPVAVPRREIALLTFIVGAGIAPQLYQEGLLSQQAWGWALVSLLTTAALWRCLGVRNR
ncbi:glycosyl hydrolase family 17 protein [Pseudomonas sp. CCI3.2]|uniref:glycoside hydrolase family 17 protein n=1 Tax=unclassified Pseudomonas TaxID=196821 RepID=UPI002AC911C3|nr:MULTISPECIES: glycosyl hydrolase family 17 protein [unclassified Pseudomonas]MEB0078110.1 glycosyl hydrolase family 17 protein [Pseudomonas sp. MH10out]MEB0092053.1 glycosyl hydrolase family 17 protein [Pseudomonas sp. CCI4.2]MEB0100522.1 glycosyl hydrolase family 17 protein [Pseudomonas sp. CCI3.2]MEB0133122.1 glycosyl hydrolase family 17 protein [Pseudomonas sp. CCI2.4]MEB0159997.1 glycosyl hydrolase family 17 protein [Pseudomonas sp. AH2 (2023)]